MVGMVDAVNSVIWACGATRYRNTMDIYNGLKVYTKSAKVVGMKAGNAGEQTDLALSTLNLHTLPSTSQLRHFTLYLVQ